MMLAFFEHYNYGSNEQYSRVVSSSKVMTAENCIEVMLTNKCNALLLTLEALLHQFQIANSANFCCQIGGSSQSNNRVKVCRYDALPKTVKL